MNWLSLSVCCSFGEAYPRLVFKSRFCCISCAGQKFPPRAAPNPLKNDSQNPCVHIQLTRGASNTLNVSSEFTDPVQEIFLSLKFSGCLKKNSKIGTPELGYLGSPSPWVQSLNLNLNLLSVYCTKLKVQHPESEFQTSNVVICKRTIIRSFRADFELKLIMMEHTPGFYPDNIDLHW